MKTRVLILALIVSVALNAAAVSTFGYHAMHRPPMPPFGPPPPGGPGGPEFMRKDLSLSDEQWQQFRSSFDKFEKDTADMRSRLQDVRKELLELVMLPDAKQEDIEQKIDDVAAVQGQLSKAVMLHLVEQEKILTPEQREKFFAFIWDRVLPMEKGMHGRGPHLIFKRMLGDEKSEHIMMFKGMVMPEDEKGKPE